MPIDAKTCWQLTAAASRGDVALVAALGAGDGTASVDPALALALLGAAEFVAGEFERAVITTERARLTALDAGDAEVLHFALSFRVLASAGVVWEDPTADDGFPELWARRGVLASFAPSILPLARFALVEAAFATGRFDEAAEVLGPVDAVISVDAGVSAFPALVLQPARLLMFRGDASRAAPHLDAAAALAREQGDEVWVRAIASAAAFAAALGGAEAGQLDRAEHDLIDRTRPPRDYIEAAVFAFIAYARAGIGQLAKAEAILLAAGGPAFPYLQVADRAMCADILIAAAIERGDLESADRVAAGLLPLIVHPGAHVLVEQAFARIDVARGRMTEAAERAAIAAARADLAGRYRDAAHVRMLRARALAALGQAEEAVHENLSSLRGPGAAGDRGVERQALRQLRQLGHRPRPAPGSGWSALSAREREVATLVAGGASNRVIASTLFLSERTIEGHVSRILAALAITSRSGIPALTLGHLGDPFLPVPALTPRQQTTAELVATGLGNAEIARRLGVSVKTVEKNVSEILRRCKLTSRTGIARMIIDAPVAEVEA